MAADTEYFEILKNQIILSLNTCFPAKVLGFDGEEAKIQPLFKTKEWNEEPEVQKPIEGVPILKQRYEMHQSKAIDVFIPGAIENHTSLTYNEPVTLKPVLKVGDIVLCVVAQRSLDDVMEGVPYNVGGARIMNMQDAVIVGVIKYA